MTMMMITMMTMTIDNSMTSDVTDRAVVDLMTH